MWPGCIEVPLSWLLKWRGGRVGAGQARRDDRVDAADEPAPRLHLLDDGDRPCGQPARTGAVPGQRRADHPDLADAHRPRRLTGARVAPRARWRSPGPPSLAFLPARPAAPFAPARDEPRKERHGEQHPQRDAHPTWDVDADAGEGDRSKRQRPRQREPAGGSLARALRAVARDAHEHRNTGSRIDRASDRSLPGTHKS